MVRGMTGAQPMIEALQQPLAYPHPVDEVRLEETHISWVLLAGRAVDASIGAPPSALPRDSSHGPGRGRVRHACHSARQLGGELQADRAVCRSHDARAISSAIKTYVQRFVEEHAQLFEQRVAAGRVRDGHGDLHAASICVEGRRLQLFDCIEFTPRYRCADVAAEVAFLAMDLAHRGRTDLVTAFVDGYVRASGDQNLARLLDFYRCYRAFVRGKVLSLSLSQSDLPPGDVRRLETDARAYFDLAWAYAGGLEQLTIVMVMGLPASGKTSLAERLAGRLGMLHLSSDVKPNGRAPPQMRASTYGPR